MLNTPQKAAAFWLTNFVNVCVVARRSRTWAGWPHAVKRRPMLIHTFHAVLMPCCAVASRSRFQSGMVGAWRGMCESNKVTLCKSNDKDIISFLSNTACYVWISVSISTLNILYRAVCLKPEPLPGRTILLMQNIITHIVHNLGLLETVMTCFLLPSHQ